MARPADPHARSALIASARQVFARKGIRGARVEDITSACGLSKGAFYLHFETKEAVFAELLQTFLAALSRCATARLSAMSDFTRDHGRLQPKDLAGKGPRYQKLVELETRLDCKTLEVMWDHREVMSVLLTGSQGTEFEGALWQLVDAEISRVANDFQSLQRNHVYRQDVDPNLFATVAVGTYLLLGKQLSRAEQRPDLVTLAQNVYRVIHESILPVARPKFRPKARAPKRRPASTRAPSASRK